MKGRLVRGFFAGLFLGIFVDIDLVFGGVVKLSSVVLTILPIVLIVVGLLLGIWAPVGRSRGAALAPSSGDPAEAPPTVTTVPASTPPPTTALPDPGRGPPRRPNHRLLRPRTRRPI